jgi:hypothetical protein
MAFMISRFGQHVEADEAFFAAGDVDLDAKRAALSVKTNPVDRHYLLQSLVEELARAVRSQKAHPAQLIEVAERHMSELPQLLRDLEHHERESRRARGQTAQAYSHPAVSTPGLLAAAYRRSGDEGAARRVEAHAAAMGI